MFTKLMKHELRILMRHVGPLCLVTVGAGFLLSLAWLLIELIIGHSTELTPEQLMTQMMGVLGGGGIMLLGLLAIVACVVGVFIVIGVRFYRSMVGQQSYFTHTLPTSPGTLLLSKTLSALLCTLLVYAATLLAIVIFAVSVELINGPATAPPAEPSTASLVDNLVTLGILLSFFTGTVCTLMTMELSVILGGAVTKKHKLLAGVGLYLGINGVLQTLFVVIQALCTVAAMNLLGNAEQGGEWLACLQYGLMTLLYAVTGAVSFLISCNLIKKRLNV